MRSFLACVAVMAVSVTSMMGCAAKTDEVPPASDSALTEASPTESVTPAKPAEVPTNNNTWDRIVGKESTTYKSGGALACGHVLTLARGAQPGRGTYEYRFAPCDEDGNPGPMVGTKSGDFELSATGIMALTEATVELKPGGPGFRLVKAPMEMAVPPGTLFLEHTGDHAQLIPVGFID